MTQISTLPARIEPATIIGETVLSTIGFKKCQRFQLDLDKNTAVSLHAAPLCVIRMVVMEGSNNQLSNSKGQRLSQMVVDGRASHQQQHSTALLPSKYSCRCAGCCAAACIMHQACLAGSTRPADNL
jgi:hypothetical protein